LLGVSQIDRDAGLWIYPCEAVHTFGMRLALDVLFLDQTNRVKKIYRHVGPNRICVCLAASSVVELAAGVSSDTGTQVNDRLTWTAETP
jgi:uncharacterized membrane protein (UPF0127 family)